jgi:5-methylcytosine-specific restriction endonuclease McrA
MADAVVERLTGQRSAEAVPVEIQLVMTDRTLLESDSEPAELEGYGPLPAPLVRRWLRGDDDKGLAKQAKAWVRRLYTSPDNSSLIAMDSRQRCFDGPLRQFVISSDQRCRTPWCDAPIRHVDHPIPVAKGGKTTAANSQGLCEACNYTKETHGWQTILRPDRVVDTITPTGHRYRSRPPPVVGQALPGERASPPRTERPSVMEEHLRHLLIAV